MITVRLDEMLRKRGRSRYWLAKETGLNPLTIAKLAKGKTSGIEFTTLGLICKALNCQPSEVLDLDANKKDK